ncbi:hypothetical protein ACWEKT_15795 [Nocardia takedensis]
MSTTVAIATVVLLGDSRADRLRDLCQCRRGRLAAFLDHHDGRVVPGREGRRATTVHIRMRCRTGGFEILRIDVAAADDDQVTGASGDVQLTVEQCGEVAGREIGPASVGEVT